MKNLKNIQQALIDIFKVSLKEDSLTELVKTCHHQLINLMGEKKAKNFYLALYMGNYDYLLPYYHDEIDNEDPVNVRYSLKGGLTDYIRRTVKAERIDKRRHAELIEENEVEKLIGTDAFDWVGAPICYQNQVHGVLVVQTYEEGVHYSTDDVELLDYVSRNIALAIERKEKDRELIEYKENLEKKVHDSSREILNKNKELEQEIAKVSKNEQIQKVLYNISEAKGRSKNLSDLIEIIHHQVTTLMEADNFYVAIVEDRDKGLYTFPFIVDENPAKRISPDEVADLANSLTHSVLRSEVPLLAGEKELGRQEYEDGAGIHEIRPKAWLGIPLKTERGLILGVVTVQSYNDPNAYSEIDKQILSIISDSIADAVHFKQLEEEKEFLEEKLQESKKMEAVGLLASGVAHEFNNLLSIIMGHSYSGILESLKGDPNYKRYDRIGKAGERAADLVEKLMVFAQKRERQKYYIKDLKGVIRDAVMQAEHSCPQGCRLTLEIDEKLWPVRIDRDEFEDVLSNILNNALQAVSERQNGYITVTARNIDADSAPPSLLLHTDKYVYIKIQDNGHGMDEKIRSQIFNPFFTTRDPGQGTGLGLAIVYVIVNEYHGHIEVESEVGEGTVFHIYFPSIDT
jgi:signal transduction histidine kinase